MEWRDLEAEAPDPAALASAEFELSGMALVGTLRRDRFPRISCVYPYVLEAVPSWGDRRFHLFAVDIETAATVRYDAGEQHVKVWPKGVELRRRY